MNTAPTGTTPTPPATPPNGAPPPPPATDSKTPDAATPPPEAEGKTAAILRQREAALVKQRQETARERADTDRLKASLAAEREAFRREQAEFRAEVDRTIASVRSGGKPQAQAPSAPDPRDKAIEELRTRLDEREKKDAARAFEETREKELAKFVTDARGGADKWPLSAKFSEQKLRAMAWNIASESAARGYTLDNSDILDRIEEELAEIAALKSEPASKGTESAANKSVGTEHQPPETTKPAPTLTSARSGETAGEVPPKKSGLKVSLEDTIAEVRRAREKLAADRAAGKR